MWLDMKAVSAIATYIFIPCLIFMTFYQSDLNVVSFYIVCFYLLLFIILIVINKIYGKLRKLSPAQASGLVLSTVFANTGNYGAPIILLAYGSAGFDYAIYIFATISIVMHTIGVYIAVRGKRSAKDAFKQMFRMPMIYTITFCMILKALHIELPDNLLTVIDLLASAAIPIVMIILGFQLASVQIKSLDWGNIVYSTVLKLVAAPIIAFFLTFLFPFDALLRNIIIILSAMPTAVVASMYAVQFDTEPELVSSNVIITTFVSIVTITVLLMILGVSQ